MNGSSLGVYLGVALGALAALSPTVRAETGSTIVVFDASGSMWGQVGGVAKIDIARQVFADLLAGWPADRQLGIMAYGHRRKGDCADIELILEPGPLDAETALARIGALKPQGRTPLTDAVEQAAEALRYRDEPATVVLLTDGIETCDRDPCALAEKLKRAGVGFTAHVVGFDVPAADRPKIACIAEGTGGRFLSADTAGQLLDAMCTLTLAAPEPAPAPEPEPQAAPAPESEPVPVELTAVDAETGAELADAVWSVSAQDRAIAGEGSGALLGLDLVPGDYLVKLQVGEAQTSEPIRVQEGRRLDRRIALKLPRPDATLESPASVPAGSRFEVRWTGPAAGADYLAVVAKGAPDQEWATYRETRDGNPLELRAPDALGEHEVRYVWGESRRLLARSPLLLTPVTATLEAPDRAPAGGTVELRWSGPAYEGDYLTVVARGAPEGTYNAYRLARDGSPANLTTPDAAGPHELRYVIGQSGRTLTSAPLTLVAVAATLEAPAQAQAGAQVEIHWSGPANEGDYLTIVERGAPEGSHENYAPARRPGPALVQAPDALGDHEIRYVVAQSGRTLASHPIELTAVSASLRVVGPTLAGGELDVQWAGPNLKDDFITLVPAGAPEGEYGDYAYARRGSPARLRAPDRPGDYELRYVVGQSRRTLASLPLKLAAAEVSLKVVGPATPGGVIEVSFQGPGRYQDLVELVPAGAAADAPALRSARASQGSPLKLFAPPSPGRYELRYRLGDTGEVAASIPLAVE